MPRELNVNFEKQVISDRKWIVAILFWLVFLIGAGSALLALNGS